MLTFDPRVASLVISMVALAVSLTVFFLNRRERSVANKRSLVLEMWRTWDSEQMRDRRIKAWSALTADGQAPAKGSVELSSMSDDARRSLNDVEHFFDGLGQLRSHGLLDERLFLAFFETNIEIWQGLSGAVQRPDNQLSRSSARITAVYSRLSTHFR